MCSTTVLPSLSHFLVLSEGQFVMTNSMMGHATDTHHRLRPHTLHTQTHTHVASIYLDHLWEEE